MTCSRRFRTALLKVTGASAQKFFSGTLPAT